MNSKVRSFGWLCGSVVFLALVYFAYDYLAKPARHAAMCKAYLGQLSLALRNYHDRHQRFPPAYTLGGDGTPWHSWRVYILPELGEQELYDAYRFDEPWNGPHNAELGSRMPAVFGFPGESHAKFLGVTGQYTAWPGTSSSRMREFHNGTSNTIMLVESADSEIKWLEPRDIPLEQATRRRTAATGPRLAGRYDRTEIVLADGATRSLSDSLQERILRLLLRTGPTGETKSAPPAAFPLRRDASSFAGTDVVPYTTAPLSPDRNCLYCATFRIAWDQLRKSPDLPVAVNPMPAIATELNREPFSLDNLDPGSFFAKAVDKADVAKMTEELQRRFPGAAGPSAPPADTHGEGRVLYAYLLKSLSFADAFDGNTGPFSFPSGSKTAPVASFGGSAVAQNQVHVQDYRTDEDFIIELKTQSERDVMLLAKIPAESTLQATMDKVLARVTSPNPQHKRFTLDYQESLLIPKLSFNILQRYKDLVGIEIVGSSYRKDGRPELIARAVQGTAFVLNERGAKLESTAEIETIVGEWGMDEPPPPEIRKFHFDRPFLVLLREQKSHEPYFALWLENTELMEPWTNSAKDSPSPP
ncbi:MAG: hypothetical protein JWM11_6388 [Planctomycetaceae bacterium]|nr:hypothetical protein [Planctomycetaceae bacterium]